MARPADPGVKFYRMETNHLDDKDLRLFLKDTSRDGYFVWHCIINEAYKTHGYFFPVDNLEDLELFADNIKVPLDQVEHIIERAVARKLFNQALYERERVLTCEFMQDFYLHHGTRERRKKGGKTIIREDIRLVPLEGVPYPENLIVVNSTEEKSSFSREELPKNPSADEFLPGGTPQSKVKESKEKVKRDVLSHSQSLQEPLPDGSAAGGENREEDKDPKRDASGKFVAGSGTKSPKTGTKNQQSGKKGTPAAPARDPASWQSAVDTWFKYHLDTGREEPSFAGRDPKLFGEIYDRLKRRAENKKEAWTPQTIPVRLRSFLAAADRDDWLPKNFLLRHLVDRFDKILTMAAGWTTPTPKAATTQELYDRFLAGRLDRADIKADHYFDIRKEWPLTEEHYAEAHEKRMAHLNSKKNAQSLTTADLEEVKHLNAYQRGERPLEDADRLARLASRIAVFHFFTYLKQRNIKTINQAPGAAKP